MIDPALKLIYERLAVVPSPIFTHSELTATGGDVDSLIETRLLSRTSDLEEIKPHWGPPLSVRKLPHGVFGVSQEEDNFDVPVRLSETDILAYELSLRELIKRIRQNNGLHGQSPGQFIMPIYLGKKSIGAWGTLDVYLSFPNNRRTDLLSLSHTLNCQEGVQHVGLIVPILPPIDSELQQALSVSQIIMISLAEHTCKSTMELEWEVAIGMRAPSWDPEADKDPLDVLVTQKWITRLFNINDETIRRYNSGKIPKGKVWNAVPDTKDKRRNLYNLRMAMNAIGNRLRSEYRNKGEKAIAEVLDTSKVEESVYQVRKKPNGIMHK